MGSFPEAKILDIDLTNMTVKKFNLPGEIYRLYPGGSALGVYLLLKYIKPYTDPLSPDNILVLSVSPLTGLAASGLSRIVATAKSPLTGAIGDSQAGGFFPAYLKGNGFDAIVIRGRALRPVYIFIDGEEIKLMDGSRAWGKVTGESEKIIREEIGSSDIEIAQIGPAGENQVRYACIINMCNRANGRNGMGAVMGSKNLKAVVVKKTKSVKAYDQENFSHIGKNVMKTIRDNPALSGLGEHGTDGDLEGFNQEGFLPTKNWTTGYFPEGASNITGTTMSETILKERDTCFGCAVRCKRVVEVPGVIDPIYGGPEYETCATFGSYCGINDLTAISLCNQLCNMYGIDTISCGATIAFAMECYEKGLISNKDTGEMVLNFGNHEVLEELIKKIAYRDGFGNLLAEGSRKAAECIGGEAMGLSMSVKGQELPAHMPQFKPSVGLVYAVNPFGADHQSSEHDPFLTLPEDNIARKRLALLGIHKGYDDPFELDDDKVRFAFVTQCYFSMLDTLCLCQFVWGPAWELYGPEELIALCKFGIGWDTSLFELMQIGERRINMMRYFNAREGFSKAQDTLPERIFQPFSDGPSKGCCLDKEAFENAKELYYEFAGWDKATGNPTDSNLRRLSLQWLFGGSNEGCC